MSLPLGIRQPPSGLGLDVLAEFSIDHGDETPQAFAP